MKPIRAFIPLALVLLLAACGGGTTDTAPPAEPSDPVTPAPIQPVEPAPIVPGEGIKYYGEWGWQYQESGDFALDNEGRFSISEIHTEPGFVGSFGFYQTCYSGTCYDYPDGGVLLGELEGEGLVIILYRVDTSENAVPVYVGRDSDGVISQDSQGRDMFEGQAVWADAIGEPRNGSFIATNISEVPVITLSLSGSMGRHAQGLLSLLK
jgi:hypothetical protein